jgi:signal transduction histidine kinase
LVAAMPHVAPAPGRPASSAWTALLSRSARRIRQECAVMRSRVRLLMVEDSADDAELLLDSLRDAPFRFTSTRVETEVEYDAVLAAEPPDVVLCDYNLPRFSAGRALQILNARQLDIPFIVVSHHIGEDAAVAAMRNGASDYLMKNRLGRLPMAIDAAIERRLSRRQQAIAAESLREANRRLQALSKRILGVQEEERRSVSRELHDDIAQSLAALRIGLHRLAARAADGHKELIVECLGIADSTLAQLRSLSHRLRPPQLDELGLADALEWLVDRQRSTTGLDIACHCSGLVRRLPAELEGACYRIAQEALNNATRHAQAGQIRIRVELSERRLALVIRDEGIGFDIDAARKKALRTGSMGLIGMEERAQLAGGRLSIVSAAGAGTTVQAAFALNDLAEPAADGSGDHYPA